MILENNVNSFARNTLIYLICFLLTFFDTSKIIFHRMIAEELRQSKISEVISYRKVFTPRN